MRKLAEQFIKDYTRGISNEIENGCYHEWLTPDEARAACIIERKETINKACEWLKKHLEGVCCGSIYIDDFRKAMEE